MADPPPVTLQDRDAARLRSLITIAAAVGASRRFDDILELAAEEARTALGAASLSISQWEPEQGVLRTLINVGELGPGEERYPADETYDVRAFAGTWPVILSGGTFRRGASDPLPAGTTVDVLARLGKASEMATAIMFEGEPWGELWATTAHGHPPFSDDDEKFLRAVGSHVAAGLASAAYLARLETLAFTDPLTGLANRRGLDEHLAAALAAGGDVSLVICDVDGLKQVNDREGHASGDRALIAVGTALCGAISSTPGAIAARIGGDEFCLLLPVDGETARKVAQHAVDLLAKQRAKVSMSCGIASTEVAADAAGLLSAADAAQYAAKHSGAGAIRLAGADHLLAAGPEPGPGLRRRLRNRSAEIEELIADATEDASTATLVARVLRAAREHLGMEAAYVAQFTHDGLAVRHREGAELPVAEALCQRIRATGRPKIMADASAGAQAGVPVVLDDGRLFGALCCAGQLGARAINQHDLRFLGILATVLANLVEIEASREDEQQRSRSRIASLLDRGALTMVFQPIRDLRDGRLVGVEALARFHGPATPPDRWFIEAAAVGLGVDLELAALEAALVALPALAASAFLSVNVSPATLCSQRLPPILAQAQPGRLVLELTEHAPVEDYEELSAALVALRSAGVRFAVDDAGAGYASLAHILRLSPQLIKLDLELTRGIDTDPVRRALASALCSFAAGMGATIVAEGIETAAELAVLTELGVPLGQGYRLGRPGPLADADMPLVPS